MENVAEKVEEDDGRNHSEPGGLRLTEIMCMLQEEVKQKEEGVSIPEEV